jgi:hypothetical protein
MTWRLSKSVAVPDSPDGVQVIVTFNTRPPKLLPVPGDVQTSFEARSVRRSGVWRDGRVIAWRFA